jgi:hypothetical protein
MKNETPASTGAPPISNDGTLTQIGPYVVDELQRIYRAMMLAPRVDICGSLLRGESVPLEELDQEWLARFGWKP